MCIRHHVCSKDFSSHIARQFAKNHCKSQNDAQGTQSEMLPNVRITVGREKGHVRRHGDDDCVFAARRWRSLPDTFLYIYAHIKMCQCMNYWWETIHTWSLLSDLEPAP